MRKSIDGLSYLVEPLLVQNLVSENLLWKTVMPKL
jgi:hypothetical protein